METIKKTVQGFILLDIDNAALNNLGKDATTTHENAVAVKKLVKDGKTYPYISGQAWRYWWRETLALDYNWQLSPVVREKKVAYTSADPIKYPDDDLFGYMRAQKGTDGGTLTRISPLKNSALIAVAPTRPVNEWSVMARMEGDPVPYEKQVYGCIMKGMFSIDLDETGTYYTQNRSGFHNINGDLIKKALESGSEKIDDPIVRGKDGQPLPRYRLPYDVRLGRVQDVLNALFTLAGGAKRTTNFADVTPKLIVLALQKGGNHPFSHLAVAEGAAATFSLDALQDVLQDYSDNFLSKIYVGRRTGFMDQLQKPLQEFAQGNENVKAGSIGETISAFLKEALKSGIPE
ncbi:MAG: type I-B CRISPR-associated protein Cas7/Cst2/DevR [Calditrichaeota bacterium]|nr:MAG: type I-B CRISPR-associated protein Cas7/Cst2/DevR [Calditrichota bacterium]